MLTTRPPVLSSGSNRFSRSWLFGAVAPRKKTNKEIADCRRNIKALTNGQKRVVIQWIPAHCGIAGSEQLAKKVALILQQLRNKHNHSL